jgi:hypothetical protein
MQCEKCFERPADGWFLIDGNAEVELCKPCVRELRASGQCEVEAIES